MKYINENNIDSSPIRQFTNWYYEAIKTKVPFYDAMALSTSTKDGKPSARMVLLKSFDDKGFVFFTNSLSRKGKELSTNPKASLIFFWNQLGKQIRIEGKAIKINDAESDEYFASRPRGSQLGAWASQQSSILADRQELSDKINELKLKFRNKQIPRPAHWHGYRIDPERIEFWQNRESRLHNRFLYTKNIKGQWKHARLAP